MTNLPRGVALLVALALFGCGDRSGRSADGSDAFASDTGTIPTDDAPGLETSGPPPELAMVEPLNDRDVRTRFVELIAAAQTRVDLFHFELLSSGSARDVQAALVAAVARGVAVRVLLDEEVSENVAAVADLVAAGADARVYRSTKRLHAKLLVTDASTLLIGSSNLSGSSLDFNHETNLIVREPAAVAFMLAYMDAIWLTSGYEPAPRVAPADIGPVRPWLDGGYLDVAGPVITAAKERLDAMVFAVNLDPNFTSGPVYDIASALYSAAGRGVPVRVLLERSSYDDFLNERNEAAAFAFRAHGIQVRFDDAQTVTHAKLLVADDAVLVGSNNWSYSGMALDHEVGVMTRDAPTRAAMTAYFEGLWAAATE